MERTGLILSEVPRKDFVQLINSVPFSPPLLDVAALRRVFDRARKNAAVGVDGVTKEQYGRDLEARLADLHERLKSQRYRHQPIRRVVPLVSPWKGRETGVGWEGDRREIGAKLRLPHEPIEKLTILQEE